MRRWWFHFSHKKILKNVTFSLRHFWNYVHWKTFGNICSTWSRREKCNCRPHVPFNLNVFLLVRSVCPLGLKFRVKTFPENSVDKLFFVRTSDYAWENDVRVLDRLIGINGQEIVDLPFSHITRIVQYFLFFIANECCCRILFLRSVGQPVRIRFIKGPRTSVIQKNYLASYIFCFILEMNKMCLIWSKKRLKNSWSSPSSSFDQFIEKIITLSTFFFMSPRCQKLHIWVSDGKLNRRCFSNMKVVIPSTGCRAKNGLFDPRDEFWISWRDILGARDLR